MSEKVLQTFQTYKNGDEKTVSRMPAIKKGSSLLIKERKNLTTEKNFIPKVGVYID